MKKITNKTKGENYYAKNKKAFHDYVILENFEAGVVLNGPEVKAIKKSQVNLKGSFVSIEGGEAFLKQAHVSNYKFADIKTLDPVRPRKLLLSKKEIATLAQNLDQKGVTIIPLELYPKVGLIKLRIGICKGKKLYDKRETLRKRTQDLEVNQAIKRYK
ncbi:MAG: SsrA-binding protein SmpB [Candidatus Peregrinibacteria bacterium]|nr:SsrA-binding protein SmpB [Candidatus Peregrinibacteria bacterium]